MIDFGKSWSLQISVENLRVKSLAENLVGKARKCTNFDSWSQMNQKTVWAKEFGRCVMKSIVRSSQSCAGISNGCSKPCFFLLEGTYFAEMWCSF